MTKFIAIAFAAAVLLANTGFADNEIDWRYGRPGVKVVTNAPARAEFSILENRVAADELELDAHVADTDKHLDAGQRAAISTALQPAATNGWQVGSHAGFLTQEQDLASLAALAAYAATSRLERIWESSNVWYTFSGDTLTRRETSPTMRWVLNIPQTLQVNAIDDIYPATNLAIATTADLPDGDYLLPSWQNNLAQLSVNRFIAGKVALVITVEESADYSWEANLPEQPRTATHYVLVDYAEAVAVALDWMQIGTTTNVTNYSFVHPPETWSYTDQTNWMEYGNAGERWVTDLAFGAANTLVIGHNVALDPHPGVLVKASGGSASGLTLTGNNTVNGQPLLGSLAVSNLTSQLLYTYTNATGVTTAQVWRTGGAVSTNFFNSAAVSVCPTNWTRPSCWPVAAGYTVDTWLTPETNLIKILTVASPRESISFLRGPGGSFQVDWYGNGTHVSNYVNNTVAVFSYPPSDHGRVIPIVAGYTNGWRVENVGGWAGYNPNATSTFTKISQMLEFVGEPVAIGAGTMQSNVRLLKHIVIGTTTILPSSWLAYSSVEKVVMTQNRRIPTSAFYDARTPQVVLAPAVTNIGIGAFQSCAILQSADFPLCETLANNAFILCSSLRHLTPMPNLKSCGNDVFQNCDLIFSVITNFVGNLQATPAAPQFIDFQENPGTPEVKAWYFGGTVSNDLETLGWKLTL